MTESVKSDTLGIDEAAARLGKSRTWAYEWASGQHQVRGPAGAEWPMLRPGNVPGRDTASRCAAQVRARRSSTACLFRLLRQGIILGRLLKGLPLHDGPGPCHPQRQVACQRTRVVGASKLESVTSVTAIAGACPPHSAAQTGALGFPWQAVSPMAS